jgi:hypothetical protein
MLLLVVCVKILPELMLCRSVRKPLVAQMPRTLHLSSVRIKSAPLNSSRGAVGVELESS